MNTIRLADNSLQFSGLEELRWKTRSNKKVGALKKSTNKAEKNNTDDNRGSIRKNSHPLHCLKGSIQQNLTKDLVSKSCFYFQTLLKHF